MTDAGSPDLDARTLGDAMAQLRELARDNLPEWRPPPEGDAGTMLHHAFARLQSLAIERLNRVPDKNLLAFLDTMGVSLLAASPARVPLTVALAPGAPASVVPAGTRAATRPTGDAPAVSFETETPVTAVPARLVAARTVDPVADRFTDHTASIAGWPGPAFAPFAGTRRMPHLLWLGTGALLGTGRTIRVGLVLRYTTHGTEQDAIRFFKKIEFEYRAGGVARVARPADVVVEHGHGTGLASLTFDIEPVDVEAVDAPGLLAPRSDRWLRLRAGAPLPLDPFAAGLTLGVASLSGSAEGLVPEAALAGAVPLDVTKDFLPFGELPRVGDAFYIGSDEVFGKPGASVKITVAAATGTAQQGTKLAWEYLGEDGWGALSTSGAVDFTTSGTVLIQDLPTVARATVGGQEKHWLRVRITAGGYGTPAEYEPVPGGPGFRVKPGTGNLTPPRVSSISLMYSAHAVPVVLRQTGTVFTEHTAGESETIPAFVSARGVGPAALADSTRAFYLGFDAPLAGHPVTVYVAAAPPRFSGELTFDAPATPAGAVEPPPLAWEYFDGTAWRPLSVLDGTYHLARSGTVTFLAPADLAGQARFGSEARYWVRARLDPDDPREPNDPRRLAGVFVNTVPAVQAMTVGPELLGSGTGRAGQVFALAHPPVLPGQQLVVGEPEVPPEAERADLELEEGPDAVEERDGTAGTTGAAGGRREVRVRWHEVPNFIRSGPSSRHYTLDRTTGVVTFGDGRHGMIPPSGTADIVATYRSGGGPAGNVPAGAVSQLVTPLSAVRAVTNPVAADGGAPAETLEMVRAPDSGRRPDLLLTPCGGRGPELLLAPVEGVTPVDDTVVLDPNVLPYPREHRIRIPPRTPPPPVAPRAP